MTIDISPTIELGPVAVAWHGIMIAAGLLVGVIVAGRFARARGLDPAVVLPMAVVAAVAGLVGARLFYLAQEDPGRLIAPWSNATEGFAFYGTVILAPPAVALMLRATRRPVLPYLDLLAFGFPFGMAIGRIGDLINGEHYGPPTDLPWGVTYGDAEAHVPETGVSYHSGALYEVLLVALLAVALRLFHRRLRRPGDILWLVVIAYSLGRFVVFFWVRDVGIVALGLRQAQWTSLALLAVGLAGWLATRRARIARGHDAPGAATAS